MNAVALPSPTVEPVRIPWTAWAVVIVGLFLLYLVLQENGALLANSWETLHELFHDGRHVLAVPCH
jgi:hypothetical protein